MSYILEYAYDDGQRSQHKIIGVADEIEGRQLAKKLESEWKGCGFAWILKEERIIENSSGWIP